MLQIPYPEARRVPDFDPHPGRDGLPGAPGEPEAVPDRIQVAVDAAAPGPQGLQPPEDAGGAFGASIAELPAQLAGPDRRVSPPEPRGDASGHGVMAGPGGFFRVSSYLEASVI